MELLTNPSAWVGLLTLTILEIVLGIDNIVFVSILSGKLKGAERERARKQGMLLAIIPRILLLLGIGFLVKATNSLFEVPFVYDALIKSGETVEHARESAGISIKDLVLVFGGLFLIYKSVKEIHHKLEGAEEEPTINAKSEYAKVIMAILGITLKVFLFKEVRMGDAILKLVEFAAVARKDGLLALEGRMAEVSEPFLAKGLRMVIDGQDHHDVERPCGWNCTHWANAIRSERRCTR